MKFMNNLRIMQGLTSRPRIFAYLSQTTAFGLTFALSIQF